MLSDKLRFINDLWNRPYTFLENQNSQYISVEEDSYYFGLGWHSFNILGLNNVQPNIEIEMVDSTYQKVQWDMATALNPPAQMTTRTQVKINFLLENDHVEGFIYVFIRFQLSDGRIGLFKEQVSFSKVFPNHSPLVFNQTPSASIGDVFSTFPSGANSNTITANYQFSSLSTVCGLCNTIKVDYRLDRGQITGSVSSSNKYILIDTYDLSKGTGSTDIDSTRGLNIDSMKYGVNKQFMLLYYSTDPIKGSSSASVDLRFSFWNPNNEPAKDSNGNILYVEYPNLVFNIANPGRATGGSGGGGSGNAATKEVKSDWAGGKIWTTSTVINLSSSLLVFINGVLGYIPNDYTVTPTNTITFDYTLTNPPDVTQLIYFFTPMIEIKTDWDGIASSWTLAFTPQSGSLNVYENGLLQIETIDYTTTLSPFKVSFVIAPPSGSVTQASYNY